MSVGSLYLGVSGSESLLPRPGMVFSESDTEILVEDRTSDATLTSDLIGKKKHFEISYSPEIENDNLDIFLALYALDSELSFKVTRKDTSVDAYTVVLRPMTRQRDLALDVFLFSGVKLVLDEV